MYHENNQECFFWGMPGIWWRHWSSWSSRHAIGMQELAFGELAKSRKTKETVVADPIWLQNKAINDINRLVVAPTSICGFLFIGLFLHSNLAETLNPNRRGIQISEDCCKPTLLSCYFKGCLMRILSFSALLTLTFWRICSSCWPNLLQCCENIIYRVVFPVDNNAFFNWIDSHLSANPRPTPLGTDRIVLLFWQSFLFVLARSSSTIKISYIISSNGLYVFYVFCCDPHVSTFIDNTFDFQMTVYCHSALRHFPIHIVAAFVIWCEWFRKLIFRDTRLALP